MLFDNDPASHNRSGTFKANHIHPCAQQMTVKRYFMLAGCSIFGPQKRVNRIPEQIDNGKGNVCTFAQLMNEISHQEAGARRTPQRGCGFPRKCAIQELRL